MEISSITFTSSVVFSVEVPVVVVDSVEIDSVVAGGAVGANDVAIMEGTAIITMGMEVVEVVARPLFLD